MTSNTITIPIRPQASILSVLKFLEYESWFALAEFVDNAIDSYLKNEQALRNVEGNSFRLEVNIEINEQEKRITIWDNAAGISGPDYPRAFRAAEAPLDRSGLSEFGMGMKSAACWFSDEWTVTTKALGENVKRMVEFNIAAIAQGNIEELSAWMAPAAVHEHYTRIELLNVTRIPRKKTLAKIKEHLTGIYRQFLRQGLLILKLDGEALSFEEPKVLVAPSYDKPQGDPIKWRKEIDFKMEEGMSVRGFVAIRETGSTAKAGFALFRRGRVIEGSVGGFRPEYIFGHSNSYRYQRVFGELHMEGFDVVFTKKDFKWDDNLDSFLNLLRDELMDDDFPLLYQADRYRAKQAEKDYQDGGQKALDDTAKDLAEKGEKAVGDVRDSLKTDVPAKEELPDATKSIRRTLELRFNRVTWQIYIELSYDPAIRELIDVGNHLLPAVPADQSIRRIGIRLSLTHDFMTRFVGTDPDKIELVLRLAAALGLGEIIATESGLTSKAEVRRNLNDLITKLSNPE